MFCHVFLMAQQTNKVQNSKRGLKLNHIALSLNGKTPPRSAESSLVIEDQSFLFIHSKSRILNPRERQIKRISSEALSRVKK